MKKLIIIFLLILLIPTINALISNSDNNETIDFTLKPSTSAIGDNTRIDSVINPTARSDTKGHLFVEIIELLFEPRGGGFTRTLYYDVLVDVEKDIYDTKENIIANITIINKGWYPDRDGTLISWIVDPDGNKFREKKEVFELIPPTCPGAVYDWYIGACVQGNKTFRPLKTIIIREIALPIKPKLGEWKFMVTYETNIQPLIEVFDSFEVYSKLNYFWGAIAIVGGIAYTRRNKLKLSKRKWKSKIKWQKPKSANIQEA